jgi:hypothetical protein
MTPTQHIFSDGMMIGEASNDHKPLHTQLIGLVKGYELPYKPEYRRDLVTSTKDSILSNELGTPEKLATLKEACEVLATTKGVIDEVQFTQLWEESLGARYRMAGKLAEERVTRQEQALCVEYIVEQGIGFGEHDTKLLALLAVEKLWRLRPKPRVREHSFVAGYVDHVPQVETIQVTEEMRLDQVLAIKAVKDYCEDLITRKDAGFVKAEPVTLRVGLGLSKGKVIFTGSKAQVNYALHFCTVNGVFTDSVGTMKLEHRFLAHCASIAQYELLATKWSLPKFVDAWAE